MKKITFLGSMLWRMFKLSILKQKVNLTFREIDDRWYVDYPEYPWNHANLEMVAGADDLLDEIAELDDSVTIGIRSKVSSTLEDYKLSRVEPEDPIYEHIARFNDTSIGRWYTVNHYADKEDWQLIWLCPVMLYTFGYYPKIIYLYKTNN